MEAVTSDKEKNTADAVWLAFRERILNPPPMPPDTWLEAAKKMFSW